MTNGDIERPLSVNEVRARLMVLGVVVRPNDGTHFYLVSWRPDRVTTTFTVFGADDEDADREAYKDVLKKLIDMGISVASRVHSLLSRHGWGDYTAADGGPVARLRVVASKGGVSRQGAGVTEEDALVQLASLLIQQGLIPRP